MARIDLTTDSVWIPEPATGPVVKTVTANSVVERLARRVNMTSRTALVGRYTEADVDVVPEAAVIPETTPALGEVLLTAVKFANRFRISEEDLNDSLPGLLDTWKAGWASAFARKLDNATLGVTAVADGTNTAPFTSVYRAVSDGAAGNLVTVGTGGATPTARDVTLEDLSDGLARLEGGEFFDAARFGILAHPSFAGQLRKLKDSAGNVISSDATGGNASTLFGYPLVFSRGAATSATATANPTGNPLLIMGNLNHLILGVRSGPESQVSDIPNWTTDEPELKMRARRGFAVANPNALVVVEKIKA